MNLSLKEKARSGRVAALNSVRSQMGALPNKVEILHREFPVKRVCEPIFSSCRARTAGGALAA